MRGVAHVEGSGRRAALAAAVGCAAYGTLKLYWALGGGLLLREAPLAGDAQRDLLEHRPNMVALNSASAALAVVGVALALATVRDRRFPRLLVVGLPALVGGLMLARAGLSAAGDVAVLAGGADGSTYTARWDLVLWSPFFAAWGAAWALAAVAARRRTAARAGPRRPADRGRRAVRGDDLAAGIVCAVFVPFVLIHLLWAVGITWGLNEIFGGSTEAGISLTVVSLMGAAAGAAVIFVTISRVGWHETRLPERVLHLGNWVAFAWPAIGTINPLSTWGMRAVTLPLAIAALVVARSHPRPRAHEAPRSGRAAMRC